MFEAVLAHLAQVGPVHADVVSVGIFLRNPRKFAELRPMTRWVAIWFALPRRARHPTITRKVVEAGDRWWHVANAASPADLDDALLDLLTEVYLAARASAVAGGSGHGLRTPRRAGRSAGRSTGSGGP